jgi:hypothetical protein
VTVKKYGYLKSTVAKDILLSNVTPMLFSIQTTRMAEAGDVRVVAREAAMVVVLEVLLVLRERGEG